MTVQITPISRLTSAQIERHAQQAADYDHGAAANPFPDDSQKHAEWNRHYYARVRENVALVSM